jgi:cation:H+ antiporter
VSAAAATLLFALSLAVTLAASEAMVRGLDRLGARLGFTGALLGLLTALGADAPEIASAVASLQAHARDVGLGVVLGSNIFNLAALLGLSAVLAGRVSVRREGLMLDGGVALLATLVTAALLLGALAPMPAIILLAVLFIPYVVALGLGPRRLARLPLPSYPARALALAVSEVSHEAAEDPRVSTAGGPLLAAWLIPPALALIVGGSAGMVSAALALAGRWHIPQSLVGALALAGLTSLPNAYAAARLALRGHGAAVVSETLNSNTINLLAGLALPALVYGSSAGDAPLDLAWLLGMTALALLLLAHPRGLKRAGGGALIGLYILFVIVRVSHP